jgi:DNA polymerase III gamma/tau subunit
MKISTNYKEISDLINSAQERGSDIVSFVDQMAIDLNNSEIFSEDIHKEKLEKQINSTSDDLSLRNVNYTIQMLNFVEALQKYITEKYGSVDTFLGENSIKVKSTFADISEEVGYPILPGNISDVS